MKLLFKSLVNLARQLYAVKGEPSRNANHWVQLRPAQSPAQDAMCYATRAINVCSEFPAHTTGSGVQWNRISLQRREFGITLEKLLKK